MRSLKLASQTVTLFRLMPSSLHIALMKSTQSEPRQLLTRARRVVVKVGSTTISKNFDLNSDRLDGLVQDLASVKQKGKEIILVTSGAIACGDRKIGTYTTPTNAPRLTGSGVSWTNPLDARL